MTTASNFDLERDLEDVRKALKKKDKVFACIECRVAHARFVDAALWASVTVSDETAMRETFTSVIKVVANRRLKRLAKERLGSFEDFVQADRRKWDGTKSFSIVPKSSRAA